MKIRNRIKELRHVKANELHPNSKNWRTHPKAQQDALKGILAEIGYADALLAREQTDGSLVLVDGHLRAETTPEEEVPVLILDIDEAESDKLLLSLDPLAALAETNAAALDSLLRNVDTGSEGLQEMYADMADAADLYKDETKEAEEDEVPEPPTDPITQPGDLWTLGNHRLLCGDSTKKEDVDRLMDGTKADMVFTDPPYGINIVGGEKARNGSIGGANKVQARQYAAIINDDKPYDPQHIIDFFHDSVCIIWGANYFSSRLPDNGRWIVWDKNRGEGTTFSDCELAWTNLPGVVVKKFKVTWDGMNREGESGQRVHPTQKPTLLAKKVFESFGLKNLVVDLFLGSGSTLIAAEQLNRTCYGMELSPQYCDVIVKRWETLTGKKAERQDADGKTRPTP